MHAGTHAIILTDILLFRVYLELLGCQQKIHETFWKPIELIWQTEYLLVLFWRFL